MLATSTKGLDDKCHLCGIALLPLEVAAEFTGGFVDYNERKQGDLNLTFCSECWGKISEIIGRDQGDAILKRKELEGDGSKRKPAELDLSHVTDEFIKDHPFGVDANDDFPAGM